MQETNNNDVTAVLVHDLLKEKRSERRWKNIRFIFWFALIAYTLFGIFKLVGGPTPGATASAMNKPYVALVRIAGMIAPGRETSAEELGPILHDAFSDKNATGVVIDINSPGGTPVQAAIIHDTILAFKKKYHKKVVIVGEDLLTSGAYYVAVAGDKIYVNPNTLTGSIGVIMKGFGFVELMKKVGIERRVYIAGSDKDRLDPFLPQTPEDTKKVQEVLNEVHQNFEQAVIEGRKGRLKADPTTLFTGDFWSGQSAVRLGLVDGLGNLMGVMDQEFKTTRFKEYGGSNNFLKMITGQLSSSFDTVLSLYS